MTQYSRRETTAAERDESARLLAIYEDRKREAAMSGEKLTRARVAELSGLNQQLVSQYLLGARPMNLETLLKFAEVLRFKLDEVSPRLARRLAELLPAAEPIKAYRYPVLSADQLQGMLAGKVDELEIKVFESSTTKASDRAFWLEVPDNAMASIDGPGFFAGMLILVDPGDDASKGDYVVASNPVLQQVVIRRLSLDTGNVLRPNNAAYPVIELDDAWTVVGKVVLACWSASRLVEVELELSSSVIAGFKRGGEGWQERINAALKQQLKLDSGAPVDAND